MQDEDARRTLAHKTAVFEDELRRSGNETAAFDQVEKAFRRSMGEFFHGWRRKTGVVTLVLALVFMGK